MQYPKFEELGTAPDYLYIGAVAIRALKDVRPHPSAPRVSSDRREQERAYKEAQRRARGVQPRKWKEKQ